MHTTDELLGPGRYTLITKRRKDAAIRYAIDDDPVLSYMQSGDVTRLTESQRTPEWFVLRKVRVTGTGAYAVWQLLSRQYDQVHNENINAVLRVLSLGRAEREEIVDEVVYTHETLNEMVLPDIRDICRSKRLPV